MVNTESVLKHTERAERHLDRAAAWLGTIDDDLAR
jgi:hypothetical protein